MNTPKFVGMAEYKVTLPNGYAKFDDFDTAFFVANRNGGTLTGRGVVRPCNNEARRTRAQRNLRG